MMFKYFLRRVQAVKLFYLAVLCFFFSCLRLNRYQLCPGKCPDCGLAHRLQQRWFLQAVRVPPSRGDAEKQHLQVGTGPSLLRVKFNRIIQCHTWLIWLI